MAQVTNVANMIAELICFEPEICICNGNYCKFKAKSVSVMRDFCQHSHRSVPVMDINSSGCWQRNSASVIGINCPHNICLSVIMLDSTVY